MKEPKKKRLKKFSQAVERALKERKTRPSSDFGREHSQSGEEEPETSVPCVTDTKTDANAKENKNGNNQRRIRRMSV